VQSLPDYAAAFLDLPSASSSTSSSQHFHPAAAATYDHGMSDAKPFPPQRPSASHAASRQAEIARVQRMTVEERVKAALGMADRFAGLQPAPRKE
jgi:hypothetical protein